MSNSDDLDFHNVCRTCLLTTGDFKYLYQESITEKCLADMLMMCTSVEYHETDGLPIQMCWECIKELCRCYTFASKCRESDNKLRLYIQKLVPKVYAEPHCSISYTPSLDINDPLGDSALATQNTFELELNAVKDELDIRDDDIAHSEIDLRGSIQEVSPMRDSNKCIKLETEEDEQEAQPASNQEQEPEYKCSICQSKFKTSSMLAQHQQIHTDIPLGKASPRGGRHTCTACNKTFKRKDHYTNHMRTHTGEKPYICAVCDSSFARKDNLKYHMKQKHYLNKRLPVNIDDKPYCCTICSSTFARKDNLKYHMRTHTGEKPYACPVCGISFTHGSSLTVHMRTHTGEKPFACTVCDTSFDHKFNLTRHMRRHTGERPYTCVFCGTSFMHRHSLTIHIRTHTGEKPYLCTICNLSFKQQQHLTDHMHRKHPD